MNHTGMKYSLVTRELICDSTECLANAHQFDGNFSSVIFPALNCPTASKCSTNSMLHLPAIAYEAGLELDLEVANEISQKVLDLHSESQQHLQL